ncbi:MAG: hypothetical protein ACK5JH_13110 [Anaerocolumna sp.]
MLNYKKPAFWTVLIGVLIVVGVCVSLVTNSLNYHQKIMVNNMVYQQKDENIDALPEGSIVLGTLESVLEREKENPPKNFQAVNIDNKYAGNALYQSDTVANTIYLEDLTGKYIPFIRVYDDKNGFDMTEQEVARILGYSSAYCYSTYEMDGGLYIIGFLAGGNEGNSDIGAGLFQYKNGQYELLSQTIHKGQALEQNRIALGTLTAPDDQYIDVILSNNENLAEIRRVAGADAISEKVDGVNPSMTVMKFSKTLTDVTYTFYDAAGQEIDLFERSKVIIP